MVWEVGADLPWAIHLVMVFGRHCWGFRYEMSVWVLVGLVALALSFPCHLGGVPCLTSGSPSIGEDGLSTSVSVGKGGYVRSLVSL
jgi:hypothetical protein